MERYTFVNKIAEGAYGTVWKCVDGAGGQVVAVKKLKEPPQTRQDAEFAMREVRLLQQISHINVVRLIEAYQSASGRLYLVFEYVDATVLQLLKSCAPQQGLPIKQVQSIIWQVAQALVYLHKNKIIHRDIKPSNILIAESGIVKLCDFGFARPFAMGSETVAQYTTYVVTRWYRPPEVLVGDTYGPAVDIWALGCIFVELVTGRPLFPGKTQHDQLWLVLKAVGTLTSRQMKVMKLDSQFNCFKAPSKSELQPLEAQLPGFTPPMMELLRACLQPDAAKRATADQLLNFSFFDGVDDALPPACRAAALSADSLPEDITHKLQSLKAAQQQQQQQQQAAAPVATPAVAAAPSSMEHVQTHVSAAIAAHDAPAPPAVAVAPPQSVAGPVPTQGLAAGHSKASPLVARRDSHMSSAVAAYDQGAHVQAVAREVGYVETGAGVSAHQFGALPQQQLSTHRQSGNLPPGLPMPKHNPGSSGNKAAGLAPSSRQPSGGVPTEDAFLQDNMAHISVTMPTGHTSSNGAAVVGPQSGIRLQAALHQSFAANRNRDAVESAKRQTWHGEPDILGGGLIGTKASIQEALAQPLQSAASIPHGALSSSTRGPMTGRSQASTAEHPTTGQLPPRSGKVEARTMRRSNTYAGRDGTGHHMISPSGTNSSHGSHAATPSHHTEDGSHMTVSTGVGSSDACSIGIIDHLHAANADTSSTSPDVDHHSLSPTLRSPMASRKAGPGDAVSHVQREWLKAHHKLEGEEDEEAHTHNEYLRRQPSKGHHGERSVHWAAPAAHQHPFLHAHAGGMGPGDESTRRASEGGVHSLSGHGSESGCAPSNNMQGSAVVLAAAHALDKASQRLTKAAKLINKFPPSTNGGAPGPGGNQAGMAPRASNSAVPGGPPTGMLHLNLPSGSSSATKLGQHTPRVSHGAGPMPQDASGGLLPRYSLSGPAVAPNATSTGQTLSLPSLASKESARPGQITATGERLTLSALPGDRGSAGVYHNPDGHSLPVINSARKTTSNGKALATKQDSISSGLGMSDYRINRGVPC